MNPAPGKCWPSSSSSSSSSSPLHERNTCPKSSKTDVPQEFIIDLLDACFFLYVLFTIVFVHHINKFFNLL